jgi:hypothetical protein
MANIHSNKSVASITGTYQEHIHYCNEGLCLSVSPRKYVAWISTQSFLEDISFSSLALILCNWQKLYICTMYFEMTKLRKLTYLSPHMWREDLRSTVSNFPIYNTFYCNHHLQNSCLIEPLYPLTSISQPCYYAKW